MEISIVLKVEEETTSEQIEKYRQIFSLLINKGALDGVKGGKAIIHFDETGKFRGVQLSYWPWKYRKVINT